jgi:SAM-dependent methyltransferase
MPARGSGAHVALPPSVGTPRQALFPAQAARQANSAQAAAPVASHELASDERLRVLHVGSGPATGKRLHPIFKSARWEEVRLDIDDNTKPDISGSIVDLHNFADDESCDAIWASHVLEHLLGHEVSKALSEFRRVLVPSGFALIRTPDIEAVAQFILDGRIRDVIYTSPAGPITPLDMIYGHGASIQHGADAMRHGTAFTADSMAHYLIQAGFAELRVTRTATFEVWAAAFMPEADIPAILDGLADTVDLRA